MTKQSDAVAERLRKATADVVKAITLRIDSNLRANPKRGGTPVDTGHARANWVPSVGSKFGGVASGNSAHDSGVAAVLSYVIERGAAWISNNVPYVLQLNDGSSRQAPRGFIEAAIAEALQWARDKYGSSSVKVDIDTVEGYGGRIAEGLAGAYNPLGGDE